MISSAAGVTGMNADLERVTSCSGFDQKLSGKKKKKKKSTAAANNGVNTDYPGVVPSNDL